MPKVGPIKRRNLIAYLKQLGFDGPYPGKRHEYIERAGVRIILPNPHRGDISQALLQRILSEAGISRSEWEAL
ncbi:MAG TPA: type II toxin-antitoxin system HicA family toxin [Ktedonobacterales bacterium]|nr:type II toxin-antitoxin system HicA family toxin [Ktedonobacterales bacterium]HEX5572599.1 type II toxin-antitoxin system HicA family toxin [Ktedonobacterales bacterium]